MGVVLHNEMDDFSTVAGGPTIITQVVQAIVHHLDLGRPLPEAVAAPRIHHQGKPDMLRGCEKM